jgi:DNA mismatch endonuclease, patch repair protein
MDRVDPATRKRVMAAVKSKDTAPELKLRRWLHAIGYRYRLHVRELPGRPDLVFPARRKVIFVHGCFWHRHGGCARAAMPATRQAFWVEKLTANVKRDARQVLELRALGWDVLIVWECQVRQLNTLANKVVRFLETR